MLQYSTATLQSALITVKTTTFRPRIKALHSSFILSLTARKTSNHER